MMPGKARTPARHLLVLAVASMAACGDTASSDRDPPRPETAALAAQIDALERSGRLPALDRSSDIRGTDVDDNGIRDDIDAWIAMQPVTPPQRKALRQTARVLQRKLLVDLSDKASLDVLGIQTGAHIDCRHDMFEPDSATASAYGARLEAMTANTRQRAQRYLAYNCAVSGSWGTIPPGDNCEP